MPNLYASKDGTPKGFDDARVKKVIEEWDCEPTDTVKLKKRDKAAGYRLIKAREIVMTASPFFGSLLYQMPYELWDKSEWHEDAPCTAFTDGRKVVFNPLFVLMLGLDELPFLLCHEIMHPALQHIARLSGRNHTLWNCACDYAINLLISNFIDSAKTNHGLASNWGIPSCALMDEKYQGMSAEQIYGEILKESEKSKGKGKGKTIIIGGNGDGDEEPDPQQKPQQGDGRGGRSVSQKELEEDLRRGLTEMVRGKDLTPEEEEELMKHWRNSLLQAAAISKCIGNMPAGIEELIGDFYKPVVDWRTMVMQYISEISKDDYTWARRNTRTIESGIYTPSLYSRNIGEVVCILDDSGSMYGSIPHCVSEVVGLFYAAKATLLRFVTCDTVAHHVYDWSIGQEEPCISGTNAIKVVGGGGTSFVPPFQMIQDEGWNPSLVLYFTDLDGEIPDKNLDPNCPVLWICINDYHKQEELPFGKLCQMTEIVSENRVSL